MFNFNLGSFGAFPIFVRPKSLVPGECRLLIIVKCSRSVWGHSVHFQFFDDLVSTFDLKYADFCTA